MKRDKFYLQHILQAIDDVERYTANANFESFSEDTLLQDGVIRKLEIIGEASKRLTLKFRDELPDIPWKDICGMRDKLIHDYFGVDIKAVWKTAIKDVPLLKQALVPQNPPPLAVVSPKVPPVY